MDNQSRNKAALVVVLLIGALLVIALKIKISTDLKLFLPEPSNKIENLLHYQLDNGASTRLVFIALQGLPPEQLAVANEALKSSVSQSPLFRKVVNKSSELSQEGLEFVEENRYLLSHRDLEYQFSVKGITASLAERIRGLSSPQVALEKKYLRRDPSGEIINLLEQWQGKLSRHKKPELLHGMWFSRDHQRTLILAEINSTVTRLENQIESIEEIRSAFEIIKRPGLELVLTGPAAFAVESGEDIRSDVRLLTWLAVIFVTLFLFMVYRSFGMLLLIFAPLLVGVIAATAGILLLQGRIHGITLAFGITLAGVAVDYPIHLLTGMTNKQGINFAHSDKIWPTLKLGVLSTVLAYAAFLGSGFGGLQQLGIFTIIGLSTAAMFSRWVLPLLLRGDIERTHGLTNFHAMLTRLVFRAGHLRLLVPIFALLTIVGLTLTSLPILHLNVDSLSPIEESRRAEGRKLRDDLGYWYGGRMMIVSAQDKNSVLHRSEEIEGYLDQLIEAGEINGYDMASQFLPSQQHQQKNLDAMAVTELIEKNLAEALGETKFRAGVFAPFEEELAALANQSPVNIDDFLQKDIGRRLEPLVFDFENEAAGVILLHGVKNDIVMRNFADQHEEIYFMHLKTSATELVARSVNRVGLMILICAVLIYFVLAFSFKSLARPLKIMVPTIAAALVTAGLLVLFNSPLSIFHLISLMLVIGLGLDYALFFNRLPDNDDEWDTTFKSLWVCGFTTILVFGILTVSQTPPLRAIGMTVGIGASLAIIFAAMWSTVGEDQKQEA